MHRTTQLIVLGAGRPTNYVNPLDTDRIPVFTSSLGWVRQAVARHVAARYYVAGYKIEHATPHLDDFILSYNKNWETTGSVGSLLCAPFLEGYQLLVCYGDIVFREKIVRQLVTDREDVALAVDSAWKHRYPRRTSRDLAKAEKVRAIPNRDLSIGRHIPVEEATSEFIGLCKISRRAQNFLLNNFDRETLRDWSLPDLISALSKVPQLTIKCRDVRGDWAELNAPQDLARFVFGTKAETLERLGPLLTSVRVKDQVSFTVRDWRNKPQEILRKVRKALGDTNLILRSSALSEDSWSTANAGAHKSVPDTPSNDDQRLSGAIDTVIQSYGQPNPADQILVQRMLYDVVASGVVFTRTLSHGAPYFAINYDTTYGKTDAVTSGGDAPHMLFVHHAAKTLPRGAPSWVGRLLDGVREVIGIVGYDSLDIEFSVKRDGQIYLLQARPIAVDHSKWSIDERLLKSELEEAQKRFEELQHRTGKVFGDRAIFGVMPDWNPAEIVGIRPSLLSISLYRYLICDEIWARQRAEYGYKDVRPQPLIVSFAGHPYVNVRASFSSFIPQSAPDELANRLVNHYLDRLEANPAAHDKVEFEVAFTCISFDFEKRAAEQLRPAGFSEGDIELLRRALVDVTRRGMARLDFDLAQIEVLRNRFDEIMARDLPPLERACMLVEDSRQYGTLAFSHLARSAFVAVTILRSAVGAGLMTADELNLYLESISTVAKDFVRDSAEVSRGNIGWDEFLARYGFLRPRTYDIESPTYLESVDTVLKHIVGEFEAGSARRSDASLEWPREKKPISEEALASLGLDSDFDRFARTVIQAREYAKFVFTRNLSQALTDFGQYGRTLGVNKARLANLPLSCFLALRAGEGVGAPKDFLRKMSSIYSDHRAVADMVELPPLISEKNQFYAFFYPHSEPNFITAKSVTGATFVLEGGAVDNIASLRGKIVIIPQADPGFDWLFGCGIVGLVTMYGGANSHMAIRSAEFGLPAAIGVGELMYEKLQHAATISIDCAQHSIRILK